jgi:exopolyphosphatase/guanosine-5'-triphosphate,3'-diphosphate pyrophosphatase
MHDIGVLISYSGHHKHSHYLVKNGDLRGFSPEEVEVIALITRYHRRGQPRKSEAGYAALPRALRRTVRTLSAFTALAEGLDRSHAQVASGVSVEDRGRDLVVHIDADADAELEVWAANRNLTPLENVLERTVRLETNRRPTRTASTGRAASIS